MKLQDQYLKALQSGKHPTKILPTPDRCRLLTEACFLGDTAKKYATRPAVDRNSPYFPNLFSGTKEDDAYKRELFETLTDAIHPSEIDESGLSDHRAVTSDWSKILTAMPDFVMKEATIPPISTKALRESYGLTENISEVDKSIAIEVLSCMCGNMLPVGLSLSTKSTSSAPFCVKDKVLKKKEALFGLTHKDRIMGLVMKGEMEEAYRKWMGLICHHLVYRAQPDGWKDGKPKERMVTDLEYALTGGQKGSRFISDKSIDGLSICRARKRTAFATAGMLNRVLSAFSQPYAEYAYSEYWFTWKTVSADDLKSKLNKFNFFLGSDTTAHDQLYSPAIFNILLEGLDKYLDERYIHLLRMVLQAPYHMSSPYLGEKFDMWIGDPFDPSSFDIGLGLPSGLGPNSFIGRWWMTSYALMIINKLTGDVSGNVDSYLRGKRNIAVLNSADDMLFCFRDGSDYKKLLCAMKSTEWKDKLSVIPNYMTMNLEAPISFLGYVPYRMLDGSIGVTSNIVSFVVNRVAPERSIASPMRAHWAMGLDDVIGQFSKCPEFNNVYSIFDEITYKHTGYRFATMVRDFADRDQTLAKFGSLTDVDREVLDNPDKVYYKFSKGDVSPLVWDEIVLSLPFEVIQPLRKGWYK